MGEKEQILQLLEEEYQTWVNLLDNLTEEKITSIQFDGMSIKDKLSHLWAWQQRSIARLKAALYNQKPVFPVWSEGLNAESEEDLDKVNGWIFDTLRDKPWRDVYADWKTGFQQLIALGKQIAEKDLMEIGKYAWLEDHSLCEVLSGSWEHHHVDHLEQLREWVKGDEKTAK